MMFPPKTEAAPSIDDHDHERAERHHPGSAAFDANGYSLPRGCTYAPLAISSTPEYQAALSRSLGFANAADQWKSIAGDFIEARKSVKLAKPYTPEQSELIESMLSAIGAGIGEAMAASDENKRQHDSASLIVEGMERPEIERRSKDPNSNASGMAILDADRERKRELIEKNGCCEEDLMSDGFCFGHGKCPRSAEVESAVQFTTGYVQWVDTIQDEAALAAVAVRLNASSPVIDSEVPNV